MFKLIVQKQRVGPILGRHPWVFSGALKQIPEGLKTGEAVVLTNEQGEFLAQGYFNSYSQIAVRLWSWDEQETVDDKFFEKRISAAYEIRKNLVASKKTDSYRLVHSENDLLPGLIVDKYADYLVVQFHTQGMETWKEKIVSTLKKLVKPTGIYERSDVMKKKREGGLVEVWARHALPAYNNSVGAQNFEPSHDDKRVENIQPLHGTIPDKIKIMENGYKFWVDVIGGQKTGFFLDQRDKRLALQKYCEGKNVLNCFSYTGGFSVYALGAGAKHVVSVDSSEKALELAEENIELNKLDTKKCEFVCGDVKQYLQGVIPAASGNPDNSTGHWIPNQVGNDKSAFDVIVLDPPAFVKDRHKVQEGLMGYKKINESALRLLPSGGILFTCSCSAHVTLSDFRYMLSESAGRARKTLQVLETFTHGIDHPELMAFTEGEYLKCIFAKVL